METSVDPNRESDLRRKVRYQLLYYIEEAIEGDEAIMKEVWEACENDAENEVVKDELKKIRSLLESGKA